MQILIWQNGQWCPFSEEEVLRLRGLLGGAGFAASPEQEERHEGPDPAAVHPRHPHGVRRPVRTSGR